MKVQVLVLAKEPRPGRVKTRLCPPCTPEQAAAVAAASLAQTLTTVDAAPVDRRTLVISGRYRAPCGWGSIDQRGDGLGERLAHAFADTARPGWATVLIGMDTPQVGPAELSAVVRGLTRADAVLGPAEDGGWWALGLLDPGPAAVLRDVAMSTAETGELTRKALLAKGLTVASGPSLRDVDTAADAHAVAALCPGSRFAVAVEAVPGAVLR